jgi:hypothetical protein
MKFCQGKQASSEGVISGRYDREEVARGICAMPVGELFLFTKIVSSVIWQ